MEVPSRRDLSSVNKLRCFPELSVSYIGIDGISGTSIRTDVEMRDDRGSLGVLSEGALLLTTRLSPRKSDVEKRVRFFSLSLCASSVDGGVDFRLCRRKENIDGIVGVAEGTGQY